MPIDYTDDHAIDQMVALAGPPDMLAYAHDEALTANQVIAWRSAHAIRVRADEMDFDGLTSVGQTGFYDALESDHRRRAADHDDALRTNRAVDLILSCGPVDAQDLDQLGQVLAWIGTGRSLTTVEEQEEGWAAYVERCTVCCGDGVVGCPACEGADEVCECGGTTEVRCMACGGYSDPWTDADRAAIARVEARWAATLTGADAVHYQFERTIGLVNLACPTCSDAVMAHDARHCTAGSAEDHDRCCCQSSRAEAYESALRLAAELAGVAS